MHFTRAHRFRSLVRSFFGIFAANSPFMPTGNRAAELIRTLNLQPHPEGGHFAEIYRSATSVLPEKAAEKRSAVTSIYYLLQADEVSRWHVVDADEIWHHYEGAELELWLVNPEVTTLRIIRLAQPSAETVPVSVVPAGWYQAVRTTGDYTLCGCTVAPGFTFAGFRFTTPQEAAQLSHLHPEASLFC